MKRQWEAQASPLPQIPALFLQHARKNPSDICIETIGGSVPPLTYGEVAETAGRACRRLKAGGLRRGSIVGACVSEGWEMVVVQLAVGLPSQLIGFPVASSSGSLPM
jgi:acyl-CoA synthetase (AMP-forming)/AMP-acid ligase II